MIVVEGLHKVHGEGAEAVEALRGIDLQVGPGELLALTGPSGSGKSSLLSILGCLDRPTSGSVRVEGRDLFAGRDAERTHFRARRLGFVFQSFNLFPLLSAQENVEYPLLLQRVPAAERRRRASLWLDRVGLASEARRRPDALSGGEKQRVAVARALVHDPLLVLADEPTANLDSETGLRVVRLIRDINLESRTTFIVATHDRDLLPEMTRVVRLRDGRIAPD